MKMRIVFALAALLVLNSCNFLDKEESFPAYLKVYKPQVWYDQDSDTLTRSLRDIWVYQGGFFQGAYEFPDDQDYVVVPYLPEEGSNFFVQGGIIENGQAGVKLPYPFWQDYAFNITQGVLDTTEIRPLTSYFDENDLARIYIEDFEQSAIKLAKFRTFNNTADISFTSADVYEGNNAGIVEFSPGKRYFEQMSLNPFFLRQDKDVWAEITYKNDFNLAVGLIYQSNFSSIVTLTPTAEWKTVYVHLFNFVRQFSLGTEFRFWMRADAEDETGTIHIDNIRVLQFK